jgi:Na+-transporting NADH:ubiquinone oxidoreductase subunit NqrE
MIRERDLKGVFVTLAAAVLSILLMFPADIAEVFSWIPSSVLARISSLRLANFIGLCEFVVALSDRFYLPLALGLNIFLLFRRKAPVWLKVLVWVLFAVAVLGAVHVETEIRHVRD